MNLHLNNNLSSNVMNLVIPFGVFQGGEIEPGVFHAQGDVQLDSPQSPLILTTKLDFGKPDDKILWSQGD